MTGRGPIRVTAIVVSRFALDGGAMFGVVPRPLWSREHPPDETGRIQMVARVLVARFPESGRVVVVDSGMGQGWSDRERRRYAVSPDTGTLSTALAAAGVDRHSVTDAVMTHLHFDHAGGWLEPGADGDLRPVLPRAVHHVQREHWKWAAAATLRDRGSFHRERYEALERDGRLNLIDGEGELFPGLELITARGHTPGMQIPLLRGPQQTVAFPADLLPTATHARPAWIMAYDLHPLDSLEEKLRILERARREGWVLVLEHDPLVEAGRVVGGGDEVRLEPVACPAEI